MVWRCGSIGRGVSVTTRATTAWAVLPVNGGSPVKSSYSTATRPATTARAGGSRAHLGCSRGAAGELSPAHGLLGAQVVRRPQPHPGLGHPGPTRLAGGERDAEIGH